MSKKLSYVLTALLGIMAPSLTAQVPYEFFEVREIVPATEVPMMYSNASNVSDALELDPRTGFAGGLTLSEPFSPSVGIYKRVHVLSLLKKKQNSYAYLAEPTDCKEILPEKIQKNSGISRSALVFAELYGDMVPLPSDSPEMRITHIDVAEISTLTNPQNFHIYRCKSDGFFMTVGKPGRYRIKYETHSPEGAASPTPSEFFQGDTPLDAPNGEAKALVETLIQGNRELETLVHETPNLTELIHFFQGFETQSLDDGEEIPKSVELMKQILWERKGQCRHRAFLFTLFAEALGYRARIVMNEVHAFVEIYHSGHYYPVDLGGSVESIDIVPTDPMASLSFKSAYSDEGEEEARKSSYAANSSGKKSFVFFSDTAKPLHIKRNSMLEVSGEMLTNSKKTIKNTNFVLELYNLNHSQVVSATARTDSNGKIKVTLRIPNNWPVGESVLEWNKL